MKNLNEDQIHLTKNKIWKAISWILLVFFGMGLFSIPFFPSSEYYPIIPINSTDCLGMMHKNHIDFLRLIGGCLGILFLIFIGSIIKIIVSLVRGI